jgi:hypothetical protein
MGPIDKALTMGRHRIVIEANPLLKQCLQDFHTLIKIMCTRPTFCRELVPNTPDYVGYCDASKLGAGGVWMSGTKFVRPTVWRLEFPSNIRERVVSVNNPDGDITNSDLEMAGLVAEYLVLEHLTSLKFAHTAAWCDNTPTVSWANKLSSSKSMVAARLVWALAMRLHVHQASPLVTWSIAGINNIMADTASRLFHRTNAKGETFAIPDDAFLHNFNSRFPHPQADWWQLFCFSDKLSTLIFSELRGETSTLGSWLRIPMKGSATGTIGGPSCSHSMTWTQCSPILKPVATCPLAPELACLQHSLDGSGQVSTPETAAPESSAKQFRARYVPLEQHSN